MSMTSFYDKSLTESKILLSMYFIYLSLFDKEYNFILYRITRLNPFSLTLEPFKYAEVVILLLLMLVYFNWEKKRKITT